MILQPRIEERVRVIGSRWSPHVHEIKSYLARTRIPYKWEEVEDDDDGAALLATIGRDRRELPLVILPDGDMLARPDLSTLAGRLGAGTSAQSRFYDVIVVGGGPAGLSAAVYAASEGLSTVVLESSTPGGQAGHSAAIENYLGFPEGLSGDDLARRAVAQAERFGVELVSTRSVTALRAEGDYRVLTLDDGVELACHAAVLAVGLAFKWLEAPGCPRLVGAGVYYGAATAEATAFEGQDVYLLGGGNSAGQAALMLAEHARHVHMLVLEHALDETMSWYLASRIEETENITVSPHTTVVGASGDGHLEQLTLRDVCTGSERHVPANGLFVFIGAAPRTEWLRGTVCLDKDGYVLTGSRLSRRRDDSPDWPEARQPFLFETSVPGVFAAGDVRHGSVKRLASAVGEGAMVVQFIHEFRRTR
jgi:thioredoxin reductase (NADPH)